MIEPWLIGSCAKRAHSAVLVTQGVVGILDYNQQSDGTPYLVVEHADGEPLRTILNRWCAAPSKH